MSDQSTVRLEPWGEGDLPLLEQLLAMTEHLGGPESHEKIVERQARYVKAESGLFKIVDEATGEGVGWVGYWPRIWRDQEVDEIGWAVLPAFQGRGHCGQSDRPGDRCGPVGAEAPVPPRLSVGR